MLSSLLQCTSISVCPGSHPHDNPHPITRVRMVIEDLPSKAVDKNPSASARHTGWIPDPEDPTGHGATKPVRPNC